MSGRNQRQSDDREVEDVPGVAEEAQAVDRQLGRNLGNEDRHRDLVDDFQDRSRLGHDGRRGLQTENDGIHDDYRDDEALRRVRLDETP
jgi:hypothetical protein